MRKALLLTVLVVASAAAPAASERQAATGTLNQATLGVASTAVPCPAEVPPTPPSAARTGQGFVRGLGNVSEAYTVFRVGPPTCPANPAAPLATTGRLVVPGKGEITLRPARAHAVSMWNPCETSRRSSRSPEAPAHSPRRQGGGLERSLAGGAGTENRTGTLEVPGFEFDLTPPKLIGASAKTVRVPKKGAKSARVTFKVTATDDVDGSLPVSVSRGRAAASRSARRRCAVRRPIRAATARQRLRGHRQAAALNNSDRCAGRRCSRSRRGSMRLERLFVPGRIPGTAESLAGLRVPLERPPPPGPRRAEVVLDLAAQLSPPVGTASTATRLPRPDQARPSTARPR